MIKNSWKKYLLGKIFVVGMSLLFITACTASQVQETVLPTAVESQPTEPLDEPSEEVKGMQVGEESPTAAIEQPAEATATDLPPTMTPAVEDSGGDASPQKVFSPSSRTGLEASDPTAFMLGSGEIQFVEFFAFW